MHTKLSLNEAVQVGPWRIARKHLLFVVVFSLVIISFGVIILLTHVFDNEDWEGEEEEDEEDEEEEDDNSAHWFNMEQKFTTGDWIVVAIMISAALMGIVALMACFIVRKDAPHRFSQRRASIYSVQFNKSETTTKTPSHTFAAPQQLPLWSGQVQLPNAPANNTIASQPSHNPVQITVSNLPPQGKTAPPPYSP